MPKYRPQATALQDKRNKRIYKMDKKGIIQSEIGRRFGITRQRVQQIVNRQQELIEAGVERTLSQRD